MAPMALQMKLAAGPVAARTAQNVSGAIRPQRMAVQQRSRHVMRATKVADLEDAVKSGAFNLETAGIIYILATSSIKQRQSFRLAVSISHRWLYLTNSCR